jgi:hypothetical protein
VTLLMENTLPTASALNIEHGSVRLAAGGADVAELGGGGGAVELG